MILDSGLLFWANLYIRVKYCADPTADCSSDIIFVLVESKHMGSANFDRIKTFLSSLVGTYDIDSGKTRVGVVTYSTVVGTYINLNAHSTGSSLQTAISSISYSGLESNMAAALAFVRTTMLTAEAGYRSHVSTAIVIITAGTSTYFKSAQVGEKRVVLCVRYCIIKKSNQIKFIKNGRA